MKTIDLSGPDGNAFALMGVARSWAKQLEWTPEQMKEMSEDFMSGDYDHLLDVFEGHFGDFVEFENRL